ncbi:hypothetical protein [Thiothrix lacustris]|jgi:hypothetical protein|uniref:hypothetical protein n=1 Tax=Thiothrix lacustris TaxID=525917 RepID=UPI0027E4C81E|nr:hypothetical protein [Thiothrix lacustris]WMP18286.1 hypothetical protein RCS87_04315 [Thiothrix lacustris]
MKTSYASAVRAVIIMAIVVGITACSETPVREAADQRWKPASACPLNSGFLWNQPDSECLIKEQQQWTTGYIT